MAKNVVKIVKLQIPAAKATPAPPVGPALGQAGVNIGEFTKSFNAQTKDMAGSIVPVVISVYEDRSYTFVLKTPPASDLLRKAAKVDKGSGQPNTLKVANVTSAQIEEIAKTKLPDLNAGSLEAAINIVKGTARSMGFLVDGKSLDQGAARLATGAEIAEADAEAEAEGAAAEAGVTVKKDDEDADADATDTPAEGSAE